MRPPKIIKLDGRAKPWRVTWWDGGKRRTAHFPTRGEAAQRAQALGMEMVAPDLAVTTEERLLIARLRKLATDSGVSIDTVTETAIDIARGKAGKSVTIHRAVAAWLADCERRNLRAVTLRHYRAVTTRFRTAHRGDVDALTRDQVAAWICARYTAEESRNTIRTAVMAWLRWCGRKGWVDVDRWREPLRWEVRREDDHAIDILRPAVVRLLLDRLPAHHRFTLALACLTGIRPYELARMDWSMIDRRRKVIEIPGSVAKIRRGRTLSDMPPAVWQWVAWEVAAKRATGRIMGSNYRNFRAVIRQHMHGLGPWPRDATRHSFASYGYHFLGAERTVEMMGHVGGYGLFARRYKACARATTARLWFTGFRPPESG